MSLKKREKVEAFDTLQSRLLGDAHNIARNYRMYTKDEDDSADDNFEEDFVEVKTCVKNLVEKIKTTKKFHVDVDAILVRIEQFRKKNLNWACAIGGFFGWPASPCISLAFCKCFISGKIHLRDLSEFDEAFKGEYRENVINFNASAKKNIRAFHKVEAAHRDHYDEDEDEDYEPDEEEEESEEYGDDSQSSSDDSQSSKNRREYTQSSTSTTSTSTRETSKPTAKHSHVSKRNSDDSKKRKRMSGLTGATVPPAAEDYSVKILSEVLLEDVISRWESLKPSNLTPPQSLGTFSIERLCLGIAVVDSEKLEGRRLLDIAKRNVMKEAGTVESRLNALFIDLVVSLRYTPNSRMLGGDSNSSNRETVQRSSTYSYEKITISTGSRSSSTSARSNSGNFRRRRDDDDDDDDDDANKRKTDEPSDADIAAGDDPFPIPLGFEWCEDAVTQALGPPDDEIVRLYHGGPLDRTGKFANDGVKDSDLTSQLQRGTDFGVGFYTTTSFSYAMYWMVRNYMRSQGVSGALLVFVVTKEVLASGKTFSPTNAQWSNVVTYGWGGDNKKTFQASLGGRTSSSYLDFENADIRRGPISVTINEGNSTRPTQHEQILFANLDFANEHLFDNTTKVFLVRSESFEVAPMRGKKKK